MNFSDADIGLVTPVQYTQPAQAPSQQATPRGGLSDSDIGLSDEDIGLNEPQAPQHSSVADFVRSIPRGLAEGFTSLGSLGARMVDPDAAIGQVMGDVIANRNNPDHQFYDPGQGAMERGAATDKAIASGLESVQNRTGLIPLPEGTAGEYGRTVGQFLGNPLTWVAPEESLAMTAGRTGIAALGSEAAGQATKGTALETPARIAGAILGAKAPAPLERAAARVATPLPASAERMVAAETLRDAGVEPTAGMLTGSPALRRAESTLGSAPFAGGAYPKALDRVNSQFTNYVAKQFGEDTDRITPEVLERARDRLGNQFEAASNGMEIEHTKNFGNAISQISADLMNEGLSKDEVTRVEKLLENVTKGFVTNSKGKAMMDGEAYQTLTRRDTPLDRAMRDANPNIAYYATRTRSALDDAAQETVDTAVKNAYKRGKVGGPAQARAMQLAQAAEQLRDARRQWFNMMAAQGSVTRAGGASAEGIVTPQALRGQLTNTVDRKTAYALGRSDLAKVARAGNLLTEGLPNSNTAERSWLTAVPSALIGGAALGEPMSGILLGASAPGLTGRALLSPWVQSYLKNQRFADYLNAPRTGPTTARAAQIATGALPRLTDQREQERARGGRVNPSNIDHSPTEAQKKAGNYAKDHVSIHGLDITIENAKGKMRRGVDKGGKPWSVKMPAHYGYIKRTEGKDGDHVDVYLGPHLRSPRVYVVDQINADSKAFDEHKSFLGFASKQQVINAYHKAFSDGRAHERLGHLTEMSVDQFKDWLNSGNTKKPLAA